MKAEIISIGTELLIGSILNTNARFLSQKLAENAVDVYHESVVGDNVARIVQSLQSAVQRADIVITSGGLGPTEDDVTVEALAKFIHEPLVFHKATHHYITGLLKKRRSSMTKLIAKQCYLPQTARVFKNLYGTAPGLLCEISFEGRKKWILVLPGPPRELEPMFTNDAFPALLKAAKIKKEYFLIRSIKITGRVEAEVAQKVTDILKWKPPLTVGIYAKPGEVELKIMAKAASQHKAKKMIARTEKEIRQRLGHYVFGTDQETLSSVVGDLLRRKKETLSIAESCSGGLLSHLVTETPGASDYFKGSVVAYSNPVKTKLLGISADLIKKDGAVSASVVKKMAENTRKIFGSNYGVGITGIAGPSGGSKQKPVGLVFIAISSKKKTFWKKHQFFGNRSEIKARAANKALDKLRLKLLSSR